VSAVGTPEEEEEVLVEEQDEEQAKTMDSGAAAAEGAEPVAAPVATNQARVWGSHAVPYRLFRSQ